VSWNLPITEFTVIPAKAGIHLYQRVMDSGSPLCHDRNDGFFGHRAFFSSLLVLRRIQMIQCRVSPFDFPAKEAVTQLAFIAPSLQITAIAAQAGTHSAARRGAVRWDTVAESDQT
jgi:hypothetical protein